MSKYQTTNNSKFNRTKSQKRQIVRKAGSLFWKKGYESTSMRDIAMACGFKAPNLYNYFNTKEDILFEVLRDEAAGILSKIKQIDKDSSASPVERLRLLIKTHFKYAVGPRRSYYLLFDTELKSLSTQYQNEVIGLRDEYEKILRGIIRAGIESKDFAPTDEKLVSYAIASMIVRSRLWFSPRGRFSVDEIADFMFAFALNGLNGGWTRKNGG